MAQPLYLNTSMHPTDFDLPHSCKRPQPPNDQTSYLRSPRTSTESPSSREHHTPKSLRPGQAIRPIRALPPLEFHYMHSIRRNFTAIRKKTALQGTARAPPASSRPPPPLPAKRPMTGHRPGLLWNTFCFLEQGYKDHRKKLQSKTHTD